MIKPNEITLDTLQDIWAVVRDAANDLDTLDDDASDGLTSPEEAVVELQKIYAKIKLAFREQ